MNNPQPSERYTLRSDGALDVVRIWHTIQGEGPHAGKPAVFVRLAGCNLACPFCDTDYTTGRSFYNPSNLQDSVEYNAFRETRLVVITGGEPFRQNLGPFLRLLRLSGFHAQVETNGAYPKFMEDEQQDWSLLPTIVCSPKLPHINASLVPHITALKYVLEAGKVDGEDGLPTNTLGEKWPPGRPEWEDFKGEVYVQPVDHSLDENLTTTQRLKQNEANVKAAVDSCLKFGYRLCLQVHKLVGLD